jgi:hypothetical protein
MNDDLCYKLYPIKNKIPNTNYGTSSILTYYEFMEKFSVSTNDMFKNIDWSNMIISGGFIFGLLNTPSNSIISGSDIDIFVYSNDENVRKDKWAYLMEYFSGFGAKYVNNNGIISIVIKDIKYDIQIILMNECKPSDIIKGFDLNYVKLYFDGFNVIANVDCLFGFKYQIAICDFKYLEKLDKRIAKTILKGLDIMCCSDIDNWCKLFDSNKILDAESIKSDMEKLSIIRENIIDDTNDEWAISDYKNIDWSAVGSEFIVYMKDKLCQSYLLDKDNVHIKKKLKMINNKNRYFKIYNHTINNIDTNIKINLKYNFLKLVHNKEHGDNYYRLYVYLTNDMKDLLRNYGISLGIETFDTKNENYNDISAKKSYIRDEIMEKMKIFKIKLDIKDYHHKKCIEKFLKYYKVNNLECGNNINCELVNITGVIYWMQSNSYWYMLLSPDEITFNM